MGAEGLDGEDQVCLGGAEHGPGNGLEVCPACRTAFIASGTILQLLFTRAPDPRALAVL